MVYNGSEERIPSADKNSGEHIEAGLQEMQMGLYGYYYTAVLGCSVFKSLSRDELAAVEEPFSQMLADLFAKHGVGNVKLAPLKRAIKIADHWMNTGIYDKKSAVKFIRDAAVQLNMLHPVLQEIEEMQRAKNNILCAPLILSVFGEAAKLVDMTLVFSQDSALNTPEAREMIRKKVNAEVTTEFPLEITDANPGKNPEAAPGNSPS